MFGASNRHFATLLYLAVQSRIPQPAAAQLLATQNPPSLFSSLVAHFARQSGTATDLFSSTVREGNLPDVAVRSWAQRDSGFVVVVVGIFGIGDIWNWGHIGRRWSCGSKSEDLIRVLVVDGISRFLGED